MTPPSAPASVQGTGTRRPGASSAADYLVMTLASVLGVGSIVLFAWADHPFHVRMGLPPAACIWWNAAISLVFFAQHSILVRRPVRARLAAIVPARYDPASYAITSGIALALVAVMVQPTGSPMFVLSGAARLAVQAASLLALAGFVWGVVSLRGFDPLGLAPIREHLRARPARRSDGSPRATPLAVGGAYRWVRHPLYTCVIVLLWADPAMTPGRPVFAALWTAWIYIGARLEERDLVAEFGERYERYRAQVPILIPWRGRVRVHLEA